MGQRSSTETAMGVFAAFFRQRTWAQSDLARALDASPRTVRRILEELSVNGWPLVRDEDHPHVYWSLPRDFLPGGVLVSSEHLDLLFRVVARSPECKEKVALVAALATSLPAPAMSLLKRLVPSRISSSEERMLPAVEDAVRKREAVRVRYYSASRGVLAYRILSIQRVLLGPPARCAAYCHEAKALRWFRLESFTDVQPARHEPFELMCEDEVDGFLARSVDGYARGAPIRVAFRVRQPEARWVAVNLPEGLTAEMDGDYLHVEAETAGLVPVARFVVGLGSAVTVETPELAEAVRKLAEGALGSLDAAQEKRTFSVR